MLGDTFLLFLGAKLYDNTWKSTESSVFTRSYRCSVGLERVLSRVFYIGTLHSFPIGTRLNHLFRAFLVVF